MSLNIENFFVQLKLSAIARPDHCRKGVREKKTKQSETVHVGKEHSDFSQLHCEMLTYNEAKVGCHRGYNNIDTSSQLGCNLTSL